MKHETFLFTKKRSRHKWDPGNPFSPIIFFPSFFSSFFFLLSFTMKMILLLVALCLATITTASLVYPLSSFFFGLFWRRNRNQRG